MPDRSDRSKPVFAGIAFLYEEIKMFCKKCGMKIERGASKCPHCGEQSVSAEYCGGFWEITRIGQDRSEKEKSNLNTEDLSRYRDAFVSAKQTEDRMIRQYDEEIGRLKKEENRLKSACSRMTALASLLAVIVILLFVLTVRGVFKTRDLEKKLDKYRKAETEEVGNVSDEKDPPSAQGPE